MLLSTISFPTVLIFSIVMFYSISCTSFSGWAVSPPQLLVSFLALISFSVGVTMLFPFTLHSFISSDTNMTWDLSLLLLHVYRTLQWYRACFLADPVALLSLLAPFPKKFYLYSSSQCSILFSRVTIAAAFSLTVGKLKIMFPSIFLEDMPLIVLSMGRGAYKPVNLIWDLMTLCLFMLKCVFCSHSRICAFLLSEAPGHVFLVYQ